MKSLICIRVKANATIVKCHFCIKTNLIILRLFLFIVEDKNTNIDHINEMILRVSEMLEIAFEVTGIRNTG